MKELVLTSPAGIKSPYNPMALAGWRAAQISAPDGGTIHGTVVMTSAGPISVRESEDTVTHLWRQAINWPAPTRPATEEET